MATISKLPAHLSSDGFQSQPTPRKGSRSRKPPESTADIICIDSSGDEVLTLVNTPTRARVRPRAPVTPAPALVPPKRQATPAAAPIPQPEPVPVPVTPPTLKRKRIPSPPADPLALALAQILDIVPDIEIAHVENLITVRVESAGLEGLVEAVIAPIFEKPYPKQAKDNGKDRERVFEEVRRNVHEDVDENGELKETGSNYLNQKWRREERSGKGYLKNALQSLESHFDCVPAAFIRSTYFSTGSLYTQAFFALKAASEQVPAPYKELQNPRPKNKGKGKEVATPNATQTSTPRKGDDDAAAGLDELQAEKDWLSAVLERQRVVQSEAAAKEAEHQRALDAGESFPCGCCFGDETWDNAVQCAEGHLFCKDCAKQYAEGKIGDQITKIACMDTSDCTAVFPDSELLRILPRKALDLYHCLKQAKEIEDAKLDGLENCPNCPWACVIEDPNEKLFRCGNSACGTTTCRKCHRPDHIPKTCEEMEAERKLDSRHAVEEAMSEALVRKCPKCDKPFIKDEGCNKITCTNCRTLSCYLCRQIIRGYDHFDQTSGGGASTSKSKCVLYNTVSTHTGEVTTAREQAQERIRAEAAAAGVQLEDADLNVELPAAPPRVAINYHPPGPVPPANERAIILTQIAALNARGHRDPEWNPIYHEAALLRLEERLIHLPLEAVEGEAPAALPKFDAMERQHMRQRLLLRQQRLHEREAAEAVLRRQQRIQVEEQWRQQSLQADEQRRQRRREAVAAAAAVNLQAAQEAAHLQQGLEEALRNIAHPHHGVARPQTPPRHARFAPAVGVDPQLLAQPHPAAGVRARSAEAEQSAARRRRLQ